MRVTACILASLLLAGCASQAATPAPERSLPEAAGVEVGAEAPEELQADAPLFPRDLGISKAKLTVGGCLPEQLPEGGRCSRSGVMTSHVSFHPRQNESALARQDAPMEWVVTAEWTPTHATAATLVINLARDFQNLRRVEGASPLEIRLPADELSPLSTYYLDFVPTSGVVVDQSVQFSLDLRPAAEP